MLREVKKDYPRIFILGDYGDKSGFEVMVDIPLDLSLRYEKAAYDFLEVQAEIQARITADAKRKADGVTVG